MESKNFYNVNGVRQNFYTVYKVELDNGFYGKVKVVNEVYKFILYHANKNFSDVKLILCHTFNSTAEVEQFLFDVLKAPNIENTLSTLFPTY